MINRYSILNVAKCFFEEDGSQIYLAFQPVLKYFKLITNDMVIGWKSKALSDESIKSLTRAGNGLVPKQIYLNNHKFRVEFNGSCLKPDKVL